MAAVCLSVSSEFLLILVASLPTSILVYQSFYFFFSPYSTWKVSAYNISTHGHFLRNYRSKKFYPKFCGGYENFLSLKFFDKKYLLQKKATYLLKNCQICHRFICFDSYLTFFKVLGILFLKKFLFKTKSRQIKENFSRSIFSKSFISIFVCLFLLLYMCPMAYSAVLCFACSVKKPKVQSFQIQDFG